MVFACLISVPLAGIKEELEGIQIEDYGAMVSSSLG